MKNLKTLLTTGILGAGLVLGLNGCGNKKINEKVNSDSLEVVLNGTPYTLVLNDSALVLDQDYEIKIKRVKSGETKKSEKKLTELEKYNLENKQVYGDFVQFVKNDQPTEWQKELGIYFNKDKTIFINLIKNEKNSFFSLNVEKGETKFYDKDFNGLDEGDFYLGKETQKFLKYLPQEKQLSLAQEYTEILKELLHEAKYKNY